MLPASSLRVRDADRNILTSQPDIRPRLPQPNPNLQPAVVLLDVDTGDNEGPPEHSRFDRGVLDTDERDRTGRGPGVFRQALDVAEHVLDGEPQRSIRLAPHDFLDPRVMKTAQPPQEFEVLSHRMLIRDKGRRCPRTSSARRPSGAPSSSASAPLPRW